MHSTSLSSWCLNAALVSNPPRLHFIYHEDKGNNILKHHVFLERLRWKLYWICVTVVGAAYSVTLPIQVRTTNCLWPPVANQVPIDTLMMTSSRVGFTMDTTRYVEIQPITGESNSPVIGVCTPSIVLEFCEKLKFLFFQWTIEQVSTHPVSSGVI